MNDDYKRGYADAMGWKTENHLENLAEPEQEPEQEPVAWRTFDGEGGYDYRTYEENENYAEEWDKRNPKHKDWVEALYITPPQRTWVGLTDEEVGLIADDYSTLQGAIGAIEAKLKEKNT